MSKKTYLMQTRKPYEQKISDVKS